MKHRYRIFLFSTDKDKLSSGSYWLYPDGKIWKWNYEGWTLPTNNAVTKALKGDIYQVGRYFSEFLKGVDIAYNDIQDIDDPDFYGTNPPGYD